MTIHLRNTDKSLLLCLLMATGIVSDALSSAIPPLSEKRDKMVKKTVIRYAQDGANLEDPDVQAAIKSEIRDKIDAADASEIDSRNSSQLHEEVRGIVKQRYPKSAQQITEEIKEEADKKYQLYSIMDYVTVHYHKGKKYFRSEGLFYSYGGGSIKVGDQVIAIFDLIPEDRAKFDEYYCQMEKDRFIDKKLGDYFTGKNRYSIKVFRELQERQKEKNEELGYIYTHGGRWRSPVELAQIYIDTYKDRKGSGQPDDDIKAPTETGTSTPVETAKVDPALIDTGIDIIDTGEAKSPEDKAKAKSASMRAEIASNRAGIDADPGYKGAFFGFTRDEVRIILGDEITFTSDEVDTISKELGAVQSIELHYVGGYFIRAVINFRIFPDQDIMAIIGRKLRDRYGLTDAEIKQREEMAKLGIEKVDKAETAAADKGKADKGKEKTPDKKKKGKKKGKAAPAAKQKSSEIQIFNWTGKYVKATLTVKIDAEGVVKSFILVKEDPELGVKIQERLAEEERLRKEAEEEKIKEAIQKQIERGVDF